MSDASTPHSSHTDQVVEGLLRRRKLGSLYLNDVRFLDARIKELEEQYQAVHDYVASWVPFDFLPDRPQDFASVVYEREMKLRELLGLLSNPAREPS